MTKGNTFFSPQVEWRYLTCHLSLAFSAVFDPLAVRKKNLFFFFKHLPPSFY